MVSGVVGVHLVATVVRCGTVCRVVRVQRVGAIAVGVVLRRTLSACLSHVLTSFIVAYLIRDSLHDNHYMGAYRDYTMGIFCID